MLGFKKLNRLFAAGPLRPVFLMVCVISKRVEHTGYPNIPNDVKLTGACLKLDCCRIHFKSSVLDQSECSTVGKVWGNCVGAFCLFLVCCAVRNRFIIIS